MSGLARLHCDACHGGMPRLTGEDIEALKPQLDAGWRVVDEHHLERELVQPDFRSALAFTMRVGALAESEGHHPRICVEWGRVTITVWTHKVDGLTTADFILAARIDAL